MLFGFSGIATTEEGAKEFVQRLVMQTIIDVLERQGRSALLPDAVISDILSQLTVDISYTPMNCPMVTGPEEMQRNAGQMAETYCIIVGNTVTGICTVAMGGNGKCNMPVNDMVTVTAINGIHLTISGTISTTNIIMANWSRMMWQSVSGQSGSNVGVGSISIALHFGNGHCRRKLISNYNMLLETNVFIQAICVLALQ
ncbi:hypothetical protein KIN20_029023 [Parelaphostrongylus tenuis]|uniref:Uncharacterized protein n=1 Tax=Parelaphostrongylus tenuis TaxID=148309 RepID=A0AAD5R1R7_PARTN|nr:hypothetical protein KIN20_029023 [Parelaphostrongylus tenuis]